MSRRILYVEDNYHNKRLVRKILAAKGYTVLEAEDGHKGVEMALSEKPDLIWAICLSTDSMNVSLENFIQTLSEDPNQSLRKEGDHDHEESPVNDKPKVTEGLEHLQQNYQDDGA